MTREIKFKVWDRAINKFINNPTAYMLTQGRDRYHALQFTDLKDKNGTGEDVYEGDIFIAVFKDCPDGFSIMGKKTTVVEVTATVVFKFGKFMVEIMHPQLNELVYKDLFDFLQNEQKVVIGNIYSDLETK